MVLFKNLLDRGKCLYVIPPVQFSLYEVIGIDNNLCYPEVGFLALIHFLCSGKPHFLLAQVYSLKQRLGEKFVVFKRSIS